ncbi:type III-A CRISPR-associated RAMP protein Csm4 [Parabacteroides sp. ZJ-118]|uniref:type III-A CRISPR-associated RAMP protein Csm4 n=1 Tax=Parabacteroides sp. ZJ-118 TaxID=2709398 RepID=UPI0013EAC9C4|nr:type III-A CRISPR-associated RAMP protein Csm4 [Parabacteroides sp. ZJ-118]
MSSFTVYKLHFTSPLHIGDNRLDYSVSMKTIQSDTLYAAVTSCLAMLGIPIPESGDLGCTISSLFPFYQKDRQAEAVYFFPKPLKNTLPLDDIRYAKKIKKVAWLDRNYFERMIQGKALLGDKSVIDDLRDEFLASQPIPEKFIVSEVLPRVTVSRTGEEDAVPFYMDRVYYRDYSGLYFLAQGDTSLLDKGLELLQHQGLGTDRNVGNGSFIYETDTLELECPDSADNVVALSLFIPENKEELAQMIGGENVAYDFVRRGGWITTPPNLTMRKNVIYAFTPASVFHKEGTVVPFCKGTLVDLNPHVKGLDRVEHPIWRNGKAIFVPIRF